MEAMGALIFSTIHAQIVDGEDVIEIAADFGGFHGSLEHFGRTVRQDDGAVPAALEIREHRSRVRKRIELSVGVEQFCAQPAIRRGKPGECILECLFGQLPEIQILSRQG